MKQAITVRYTVRGDGEARITATCKAKRLSLPWDYALDQEGNETAAARALAREMDWLSADHYWVPGRMCTPRGPDGHAVFVEVPLQVNPRENPVRGSFSLHW